MVIYLKDLTKPYGENKVLILIINPRFYTAYNILYSDS